MLEQDDLINVINVVNELDYVTKEKGLELDCWKLYRTYHNIYLIKHGNNTKYIDTNLYERKMNARYDYVIERINCTIENKLM